MGEKKNVEPAVQHLRALIGRRVRYQGEAYEIIEVLEDNCALVLQSCGMQTSIQPDQHGEAHRRVPETYTIHIPLEGGAQTDHESLGFDLLDEEDSEEDDGAIP